MTSSPAGPREVPFGGQVRFSVQIPRQFPRCLSCCPTPPCVSAGSRQLMIGPLASTAGRETATKRGRQVSTPAATKRRPLRASEMPGEQRQSFLPVRQQGPARMVDVEHHAAEEPDVWPMSAPGSGRCRTDTPAPRPSSLGGRWIARARWFALPALPIGPHPRERRHLGRPEARGRRGRIPGDILDLRRRRMERRSA